MSEMLTADGLLLALATLKGKWGKQGAVFADLAEPEQGRVVQTFTFDDQTYEVSVYADKSLHVTEVEGAERRPVSVPRGLPFPKGFLRTEGYDR